MSNSTYEPITVEEVEKTTLRLVTQAIFDFRHEAKDIFAKEQDLESDIAEDVTREALDRMGFSRIQKRLFGKVDYKRACYLFQPNYVIRQALFVDSKAEKGAKTNLRLQLSQTSMEVRTEQGTYEGGLPKIMTLDGQLYLTTTIFVKYVYSDPQQNSEVLTKIYVIALPNGILQDIYNPNSNVTIWNKGPHSIKRQESFRVRISFKKLKNRSKWRVQEIDPTKDTLDWSE